jgi:hypothetical protein
MMGEHWMRLVFGVLVAGAEICGSDPGRRSGRPRYVSGASQKPKASKAKWDPYHILRMPPAQDLTIPLAEGIFPFVKH